MQRERGLSAEEANRRRERESKKTTVKTALDRKTIGVAVDGTEEQAFGEARRRLEAAGRFSEGDDPVEAPGPPGPRGCRAPSTGGVSRVLPLPWQSLRRVAGAMRRRARAAGR